MNNQQEQSAGYLILTSTQGIHFYGLRIFEFLRFMVKAYYPATTNWERQLDPERLLIHLMSYNAASVLDQLQNRAAGSLQFFQGVVNRSEQYMLL